MRSGGGFRGSSTAGGRAGAVGAEGGGEERVYGSAGAGAGAGGAGAGAGGAGAGGGGVSARHFSSRCTLPLTHSSKLSSVNVSLSDAVAANDPSPSSSL